MCGWLLWPAVLCGGGGVVAWGLRPPLGYAIANTLSMEYMWMPFLVAWLIEIVVLRYGGSSVYRRLIPLFLGLILGDFVTASAWAMYGFITEQRLYFFFPH